MVNSMAITLLDDAGTALDITDVSTWDLGITEDFFGETGVLAGSSTITAAENVLAVTMNGHTEELASLMDGKKSIQAYATLRGRDASDVLNRLYVFPVVILNIGFTNDTILTTAAQELTYTKAQIDYLLSQLPGGTGAEKIENKTQEIDTEEPSADKYPSEVATVTYVAGQVSSLNTAISGKVDKEAGKVLSDNNFTTAEKNKLEIALTSVPDASTAVKGVVQIATGEEVTAGEDTVKAVVPATLKTELDKKANTSAIPDITGKVDKVEGKGLSTNDYTNDDKTAVGKIELETLAELTGADVTVAPWTQSKWSASGTCTLTASGWALSGFQWSQIVITVLPDAVPAIAGTEELSEDDALSGAGVYHAAFINLDGKIYFHVSSFVPAEVEE
jgi:hypothetical protein